MFITKCKAFKVVFHWKLIVNYKLYKDLKTINRAYFKCRSTYMNDIDRNIMASVLFNNMLMNDIDRNIMASVLFNNMLNAFDKLGAGAPG